MVTLGKCTAASGSWRVMVGLQTRGVVHRADVAPAADWCQKVARASVVLGAVMSAKGPHCKLYGRKGVGAHNVLSFRENVEG